MERIASSPVWVPSWWVFDSILSQFEYRLRGLVGRLEAESIDNSRVTPGERTMRNWRANSLCAITDGKRLPTVAQLGSMALGSLRDGPDRCNWSDGTRHRNRMKSGGSTVHSTAVTHRCSSTINPAVDRFPTRRSPRAKTILAPHDPETATQARIQPNTPTAVMDDRQLINCISRYRIGHRTSSVALQRHRDGPRCY